MADAMVKQAIAIDPKLANAKKLKTYIDAKQDRMSQKVASAPQDSSHGQTAAPHGQTNSTLPATIQENSKNPH